jgi:polysaccharide deacetylase 2 family uncharacterized protein YibQ
MAFRLASRNKSLADRQSISPVLKEIAYRGLGYVDDDASFRSVTSDLAVSSLMPSARADGIIDAGATPSAQSDGFLNP